MISAGKLLGHGCDNDEKVNTISGYDYRAYHAGGFDVDAHDAASVAFIESGTYKPFNRDAHSL
jgi:hypothetical protein